MNFRAHDLPAILQKAFLVERRFSAHSSCGKHTEPEVTKIRRKTTIILPSPHATSYPRVERTKLSDIFTGTLAIHQAWPVGASMLFYARITGAAPNDDADSPCKRQMHVLVASTRAGCMLDLASGSAYDAPGDSPIPSTTFLDTCARASFDNDVIGRLFSAARTITTAPFTWSTCHPPVLQVAIHTRYCDPARDPVYATLLSLLCETPGELQQWL
jgi:hypothetical protein